MVRRLALVFVCALSIAFTACHSVNVTTFYHGVGVFSDRRSEARLLFAETIVVDEVNGQMVWWNLATGAHEVFLAPGTYTFRVHFSQETSGFMSSTVTRYYTESVDIGPFVFQPGVTYAIIVADNTGGGLSFGMIDDSDPIYAAILKAYPGF
jgi:hypothetical protein